MVTNDKEVRTSPKKNNFVKKNDCRSNFSMHSFLTFFEGNSQKVSTENTRKDEDHRDFSTSQLTQSYTQIKISIFRLNFDLIQSSI